MNMSDKFKTIQRFQVYLEHYGNLPFSDFEKRVWAPPAKVPVSEPPITEINIYQYAVCSATVRRNNYANRFELLISGHTEWVHYEDFTTFDVHRAITKTLEDKFDAKIKHIKLMP